MFARALVVVDGEGRAESVLPWLRRLAGGRDAAVQLLAVLWPPDVATRAGAVTDPDELEARARATALDRLRPAVESLTADGIAVSADVRFGDPARLAIAVARARGADVIALAAARRRRLAVPWRRTLAERLADRTPVPLLVGGGDDPAAA